MEGRKVIIEDQLAMLWMCDTFLLCVCMCVCVCFFCRHVIFDTPGQIEVFTWSASGSIITETLVRFFTIILSSSFLAVFLLSHSFYNLLLLLLLQMLLPPPPPPHRPRYLLSPSSLLRPLPSRLWWCMSWILCAVSTLSPSCQTCYMHAGGSCDYHMTRGDMIHMPLQN